jgi:hypothetical protein
MKNFLEKFRTLAKEISNHPKLVLLDYQEFKPISDAEFNDLENDIGFKISKELKQFYQLTNGIKLTWIHIDDYYFNSEKHTPFILADDLSIIQSSQAPEFNVTSHEYGGVIDIKGILEVFQDEFPNNPYAIEDACYVFDTFSNAYGAAISFPDSKEHAIITVSGDYEYFGSYNNSMPFLQYLDFILETKGLKIAREYLSDNINREKYLNIFRNKGIDEWPKEFARYEN